jgi:hemerythrin superfamily protein
MDFESFVASPRITMMIKLDHTHVLAAFHRFRTDAPQWRKVAIVNTICAALEIHAQLEEEIFYPALRAARPTALALDKSVPEHDAMREIIEKLRAMEPDAAAYDETLMELMREVLHHVADEETVLLPIAEESLGHDLRRLGARMNTRRAQLVASRPAELAINSAGAFPVLTLAVAGAITLALGSAWHTRNRPPRDVR